MRIGLHCTSVFSKIGTPVSIASLRQFSCKSPYGHHIQVFNKNINLSPQYAIFGGYLTWRIHRQPKLRPYALNGEVPNPHGHQPTTDSKFRRSMVINDFFTVHMTVQYSTM